MARARHSLPIPPFSMDSGKSEPCVVASAAVNSEGNGWLLRSEDEPPAAGRGCSHPGGTRMNYQYFAKEDPWQVDLEGNDGLPVILARRGDAPGSEAIWNLVRGVWEPFPDLWGRLMGGDWWDGIAEERARCYFDAEAFAGGEIQQPLPEEEMNELRKAYWARKQQGQI